MSKVLHPTSSILYYIILCHIISYYNILYYITNMLYYVMLYYIMLYYILYYILHSKEIVSADNLTCVGFHFRRSLLLWKNTKPSFVTERLVKMFKLPCMNLILFMQICLKLIYNSTIDFCYFWIDLKNIYLSVLASKSQLWVKKFDHPCM